MEAYIRFSMPLRRSLMTAICCSRSFWVAVRTARRAVASARSVSSAASSSLDGGQPRRLAQRGAAVLELRDGGIEVLDGQQLGEVVGHGIPS